MTSCNFNKADSPIYNGRHLEIAVIGESPAVREENVHFKKITLAEIQMIFFLDYFQTIVKQRTLEQKAKIININDGKRYWFTTFDVLEDSVNGEGDPLKIEAFDKEGNLYWKSGVYEDGLYQGRTNK